VLGYGWPDYVGDVPVTDPRFTPERGPHPAFVLTDHDRLPRPERPLLAFPPHAQSQRRCSHHPWSRTRPERHLRHAALAVNAKLHLRRTKVHYLEGEVPCLALKRYASEGLVARTPGF
jgi:hypothetical protein